MLDFLWFVRCTDDLPTATARIRAEESGRHTLIAREEAEYKCQPLTKAQKKMFGNASSDRTLKGSRRCGQSLCCNKLPQAEFSS